MIGRVSEPKIGRIYSDYKREAYAERKPRAFDTPFRFSGSMDCARQLGYSALGTPETDPMDGPSHAIADMGSLLHVDIQDAVTGRFPSALIESKGILEQLSSGSVDIDLPDDDESCEIKTVTVYKFDRAIGLNRMGKYRGHRPEKAKGPGLAFWCQGGMNARANGRSNVRIILVAREAVSVNLAEECDFTSLQRFWWEWTATEDEWGPLVDAELHRLGEIAASLRSGFLPDRQFFDDDGSATIEDPDSKKPFPCPYCSWRHQCRMDGGGPVAVSIRGAA